MSAPPRKGNRGQDFRTLPDDYSPYDDALIDVLIRNVMARQGIVRSLMEDDEDVRVLEFVGSARTSDGVERVLGSIREILEIDHNDFYSQSNQENAFGLLRSKAEVAGVIVLLKGDLGSHHTKIKVEIFRGFALADKIAPFIVINDQDNHGAWSFTLLHELTHIILGQSGISGERSGRGLEKFCNDVASEFLLPRDEVAKLRFESTTPLEEIESLITKFARQRNLSSSMVAYKLFRVGGLDEARWSKIHQDFRERWLEVRDENRQRSHESTGGPSYYMIRRHRVGQSLINFVDRMLASGALTTTKAGTILDVKPKNVQNLINPT
jgi:Zn-dependent peptidase ImmA (M78 family)